MQYGTRITGALKPRFVESAGIDADLSVPGEVYQFDIETEGFSPEQEEQIITQLLTLEAQTPDLKILHINADYKNNVITIQFTDTGPNPFSFIGLLGAMPFIFGLLLIAVLAYTLWTVYSSNPLLLWAILALGTGVAFFYFTSTQFRPSTKSIYETGTTDKRVGVLQEEAKNQRQQIGIEHDKKVAALEQKIKELQEAKREGTIPPKQAEAKIEKTEKHITKIAKELTREQKEIQRDTNRAISEQKLREKNKEKQNVNT